MSCAGCVNGVDAQQRQQQRQVDRIAARLDVCVRYTGSGSVQPFFARGVLKHFGDVDNRRVGVIPAYLSPDYLEENGRFYGQFEACPVEEVNGDVADNIDGEAADNADGEAADNADGEAADNADGEAADNADGEAADNADGEAVRGSRGKRQSKGK